MSAAAGERGRVGYMARFSTVAYLPDASDGPADQGRTRRHADYRQTAELTFAGEVTVVLANRRPRALA